MPDEETTKNTEEQPTEGAAQEAPNKRKLLLPIVGTALSIGLAVVFACVIVPPTAPPEQEEAPPEPTDEELGEETLIPLPPFQSTLGDTNREGYLRMSLTLEVRCPNPDQLKADIEEGDMRARIQDTLITHSCGKLSADLKTVEGKESLKLELIERLNELMFAEPGSGKVTGLYFVEFLVQ